MFVFKFEKGKIFKQYQCFVALEVGEQAQEKGKELSNNGWRLIDVYEIQ